MEPNGFDFPTYIVVHWRDPKAIHGWVNTRADKPAEIISVGILLNIDDQGVSMVESLIQDDDVEDKYGCSIFIEWGVIVAVFRLGVAEAISRDRYRRERGEVGDQQGGASASGCQ